MQWAHGSINKIEQSLEDLKNGQIKIIDRFAEINERIFSTNERITAETTQLEEKFYSINEKITAETSQLEEKITATNERITNLQVHLENKITETNERISSLQVHLEGKIAALQAHTDEKFLGVYEQFNLVHKEIAGIHRAISIQTKWQLASILASASLISILLPVMLKLL
ncbi:MAG: hypothetical protein OEZ34_15765 [Spirochaetia bacterium]|nr:hypothetical protein [Spirochaetia bacterium]